MNNLFKMFGLVYFSGKSGSFSVHFWGQSVKQKIRAVPFTFDLANEK